MTRCKELIGNISYFDVGYSGDGNYVIGERINGKSKPTIQFRYWYNMIQRCYSDTYHKTHPTYKNCIVCDEWLNFQNFAKWFDNNYYQINDEKMYLDKDLLLNNNKIYSPNTCVFVPAKINMITVKIKSKRGNYPIGVYKSNISDKYATTIKIDNKTYNLGYYNNVIDAFNAYKKRKEQYIKDIAERYKPYIPNKLYDALLKYKINIDD